MTRRQLWDEILGLVWPENGSQSQRHFLEAQHGPVTQRTKLDGPVLLAGTSLWIPGST